MLNEKGILKNRFSYFFTITMKITKGRITNRVKVLETMPGGRFSGSRNMCYHINKK